MKKPKVLNLFGGIRGFKISKWQSENGYDATVLSVEDPDKYKKQWQNSEIKIMQNKFLSWLYEKLSSRNLSVFRAHIFLYFFYIFTVGRACKRDNIDVIFAQRHTGAFVALTARKLYRLKNIKIIFDYQDAWHLENNPPKNRVHRFFLNMFYSLEKKIMTSCDGLVTQGQEQIDMLEKRYKISMPVTFTINTADIESFKPSPIVRQKTRKKYSFEKNKVILYTGSIVDYYGVHLIPDAAKNVIDKYPDTLFVFLGIIKDKKYWNSIKNKIKDYGIEDNFIELYPEKKEEIPKITAACDIGLVTHMKGTKIGETSIPTKMFEYMASGLAVVTSDMNHLTQFIRDYNCGIAFEPNSSEDLARKISILLKNKKKLNSMKLNARKACEERYNWDHEMKKVDSLTKKLLHL